MYINIVVCIYSVVIYKLFSLWRSRKINKRGRETAVLNIIEAQIMRLKLKVEREDRSWLIQ